MTRSFLLLVEFKGEEYELPIIEHLEAALTHSTVREALATAVDCDVNRLRVAIQEDFE